MLRKLELFKFFAAFLALLLFPIPASAACDAPLECYENAISLLKQRAEEFEQLAARLAAAEAEINYLRSQNMDLAGAFDASEARLASGIRSLDSKVERKVNDLSYTFVNPSESCPPGWTPLGVIGWLVRNEDRSRANFGGDYGRHGTSWSWTHPYLCRNN